MNQSGYADLKNESVIYTDQSVIYILILPNLNPNSVPYIDASNQVQDIVLNDGQIVIGSTGNPPIGNGLTGTLDEINISNGPGTITLSTPQAIATTSSPTFANITINGNVVGFLNTRACDDIISCSTAQTTNNLVSFDAALKVVKDSGILSTNIVTNTGTGAVGNVPSFVSDKVIQDSGKLAADLVTGPAISVNDDLCSFNLATGKIIKDSGILSTNVVTNTGTGGVGNLPSFVSNKVIQDSGKLAADVVTGPVTAVNDNICSFNLATGKIIKDSGISTTSITGGPFLPLGGGTMSGGIAMGNNSITGISLLSPNATNILYGTTTSSASLRDVAIGNTNVISTASNDTISIGSNMTLSNTIPNNVLIGNNITCASGGSETVCIGKGSSNGGGAVNVIIGELASITGTGTSNVVVGQGATMSNSLGVCVGYGGVNSGSGAINIGAGNTSSATKAHTFGAGITNSTANSLLIDATANIRPNTNGATDLGTSSLTFKDIYSSGTILSSGTADSTTTTTGAVQTTGGVGITKSVIIGANLGVQGTTDSTTTTTGSIQGLGGLGLAKALTAGGIIKTTDTTDSTTTTTGSFQTGGGAGIAKAAIIGTNLAIQGTTDASSTITGSFQCLGGGGISKKLYIGDSVFVNTTSATAKIVVSGGVQNTAGEDSAIRTISSSTATKIELNNTAASGKIYELRSLNSGTFDITDRTGAASRFMIDTNGNFGFNSTSFGGGKGVLYIFDRNTAPTSNPANGGILYCESGALKYRGSGGTTTTIANA